MRRALRAVMLAATAATLNGTVVHAQSGMRWGFTGYGTADIDQNSPYLLAGVVVAPMSAGWGPLVGVQGFWTRYPGIAGTNVNASGVQPYAGLQYNYGLGALSGRIGYQFQSNETSGLNTAVAQPVGKGTVITGQLEHWGTGRSLAGEAIATYNFGPQAFWGRGRVTARVAQTPPGTWRLGGEVAVLNQPGFTSTSVGPYLQWETGHGVNLGLGAGRRFQDFGDVWYVRFDIAAFSR